MKQNSAAGVNFCIQVRYFWHHGRYINNILTVGMVPALFPDDEKEPLVGAIRARCGTVTLVLKYLPDCSPLSMFRARGEGVSETGMWAYACGAIYSAWAPCTIDPLQTKWQNMAKCRLFWLCPWSSLCTSCSGDPRQLASCSCNVTSWFAAPLASQYLQGLLFLLV